MNMLMDKAELFANAHPDFLYSGYLLARAGINALGLGELQRSCLMLSQSLKMPWGITESKQKDLKPYKDGTEWVLTYLKNKKICK